MTTLGKILAIVNLVLSLVVGAFIVMSYVARTNWYAAYNLVNAQLTVAKADAEAYRTEVGNAQKVITGVQAELKAMDQDLKKTKVDSDLAVKRALATVEAEKVSTG